MFRNGQDRSLQIGLMVCSCPHRGRTSCARRSPTGRPYSARTGAIPSWGMPANSTHPRRQHKRGDWVWSTTRAGRGRHAQGPASPISGGRRKADCGTQAERMWSRGPAGSVTRRRFAAGGKVSRPAGRNPLEAETVGWKEDPSSVTAYAVPPSPLWGEGFECASRGRPCAENPALSRQHRTMTSA